MFIAKQSGTLTQVLAPLTQADSLPNLYTKEGGYLRFDDKNNTWQGSHVALKPKEMDDQHNFIIHYLCTNGLPTLTIPQREEVARKVNEYFFPKTKFNTEPDKDGSIRFNSTIEGRQFLSNFFSTLIVDSKGDFFPSVEACYHNHVLEKIGGLGIEDKLANPITIKKAGEKTVKSWFIKQTQDEQKKLQTFTLKLMEDLSTRKYDQSRPLNNLLLKTGDAQLIERSTTDHFFAQDDEGKGNNHLGKILAKVRER